MRKRLSRTSSALNVNNILHVITGLVPVIPIGEAQRIKQSGWPGQARP
jgi:hypothetical protein